MIYIPLLLLPQLSTRALMKPLLQNITYLMNLMRMGILLMRDISLRRTIRLRVRKILIHALMVHVAPLQLLVGHII